MAHYATDKEHPLRYACDRCHAHKLRCNRVDQSENGAPGAGKSCSRCLKARTRCVIGLRGKVGRPAKNTKRKNEDGEAARPPPYHDARPRQPDQSSPTSRACIVAAPAEPDAGLLPAMASHAGGADEGVDVHMYTGLPSPSQYLAAEVQPFPFSPGEMESWETLGLLPYEFKTPFSPAFGFGPSAPHDGEAYSLAPSDSTAGGDGDGLESDFETAAAPASGCAGALRMGSSFASAMPDAQKPPTPASTAPPAGTQSIHERLCELSLRISTAASGLAEHGASAGDVALKDVSCLASELIDAARQIVPQLHPDPSAAPPPSDSATPAEARGQQPLPLPGSPAPSPSAGEPPHRSSQVPRRTVPCVPDAGLIFLLLACYAGLLSALERVLDGLWAQHEYHNAGRGAPSLSSRLESSLAAHAVHYLFTLLREALCLPGQGDGSAAEMGDAGRPSSLGLLTATCADIARREEDIQKRAERLQQALIR